eukprot:gb/GEZJ01007659.1/.p1 GENE.gb/GEZJ01007659.1/~~gb/GEZJ01007659.1/.p1  ORF type:complete len:101 (+),score=14.14 gb/GEZJ01007659.1/:87-389(+)
MRRAHDFTHISKLPSFQKDNKGPLEIVINSDGTVEQEVFAVLAKSNSIVACSTDFSSLTSPKKKQSDYRGHLYLTARTWSRLFYVQRLRCGHLQPEKERV